MTEISEEFSDSYLAILESIVKEPNELNRKFKLQDFVFKFLHQTSRQQPLTKKKKFDLIIFTIVPIEFQTIDNILKTSSECNQFEYRGWSYTEFQISRPHNRRPLSALLTLVGTAGDVNCSLACARIFQTYDFELAILCGIAAGIEEEIKKYGTVIANTIVNYEFQRIEEDGITYRPLFYKIDRYNEKVATRVVLHVDQWRKEFLGYINQLNIDDSEFDLSQLNHIEFKSGEIASGAKLLADGKTLQQIRKSVPVRKGIIAAEMEGSGFSPACDEFELNWLVFRGISDYGEADKDNPINKKYQKVAAASAGFAMLYYLKNLYRTKEERGEEELPF